MKTSIFQYNFLAIALPFLRIFPLFLIGIATIAIFYAAALSFNGVYVQSIGSSLDIFSELFIFGLVPVKPGEAPLLEGPSHKLSKEEKAALSLPEDLKQILVGLLLGDLCSQKQSYGGNPRLIFSQGLLHKDYIFHLYELFYPEGKKALPSNIAELLTPLGLAYLLCDDGCYDKRDRAVIICTECFLKAEVELLASVLTNKFNLKCSVIKNRNGFRVRISAKSLLVLQSLLKDIMPPMMMHKIGL